MILIAFYAQQISANMYFICSVFSVFSFLSKTHTVNLFSILDLEMPREYCLEFNSLYFEEQNGRGLLQSLVAPSEKNTPTKLNTKDLDPPESLQINLPPPSP